MLSAHAAELEVVEVAIDAHRDDRLVGWGHGIDGRREVAEPQWADELALDVGHESAHDGERRLRVGGDRRDGAVAVGHPRLAVDDHQFAVEMLDGADAEIAPRQEVSEPHVAVVVPVDEGGHRAGLHDRVRGLRIVTKTRPRHRAHV